MMNDTKRLYRIESGAKLAGVCGGIAEFFNLDPNIIRLLWVAVTVYRAGIGLALYIVAALVLPRKSDVYPGC